MKNKTPRYWDFLVLWPFIYFALALVFVIIVGYIMATFGQNDQTMSMVAILGLLFFLIHISSIILMIVVYIYAIHNLYTNTSLSDDKKRTWLILIVLFNFIAIPILHFMHLRK